MLLTAASAFAIGTVPIGATAQETTTETITDDEALEAAADALDEAADKVGDTKSTKKPAKAGPAPMKLWNPFRPITPVVADFVDRTQDLLASDTKRKGRLATRFGMTALQLDRLLAFRVLVETMSDERGKEQLIAALQQRGRLAATDSPAPDTPW